MNKLQLAGQQRARAAELTIYRDCVNRNLAYMQRSDISTASRRICYDTAEEYCRRYQAALRGILVNCGLGVEEWGGE
jgi:hypothetical protein